MSAFAEYRDSGGLPQAIEISGAGTAEANGVYKASDKTYCDAPVYEHTEAGGDFKITREPHTNPKTGAKKHGWLLGRQKAPLYGAQTESLTVPSIGWKKFGGEAPVPQVVVHQQLVDVFFARADDAKAGGDAAMEREEWSAASQFFTEGVSALKQSGERFGDPFRNRAALLLSRRAGANAKQKDFKAAMRDAVAALELVRGLTSAEVVAVEAAMSLGCQDSAHAKKILEPIGSGKILDSGAPLVLRCVERWVNDVSDMLQMKNPDLPVPAPRHLPSDRYLENMDDKAREEVIKKHLPEFFQQPGGTGIIKDPTECLALMKRWEEVFAGQDFQQKRKDLWNRQGLNFPMRLRETRKIVAESLSDVLEPLGFAPGQPGLTRVVGQMQVYWSRDKACASKALDLEELADVSLADLE